MSEITKILGYEWRWLPSHAEYDLERVCIREVNSGQMLCLYRVETWNDGCAFRYTPVRRDEILEGEI